MHPPRLRSAVLLVLLAGCSGATNVLPEGSSGSVTIVVEFDGREEDKSFEVPIVEGQSAYQAMLAAMGNGDLEFETDEHAGSPFVSGIGGVSGEGIGDDDRNWMYWINDELATVGIGSLNLRDGDELTWRFTTYDEARTNQTGADQ